MTRGMKNTALLLVLVFTACVKNPIITKDGALPAGPKPSEATLVIAQSFTYPAINVIDDTGKIVAQVGPRQHTVVGVPAGPIKLAAFPGTDTGRGDRVVGTVEAGKVYYLAVGFRMGGITFQGISERVSKEDWATRKTYVTDLAPVTMDAARVGEVEAALGEGRAGIFKEIDGEVSGWNAEELKARAIEPADGDPAP